RFPMSIQEIVDPIFIELARDNFRRVAFPPIRFISAVMESDAAELAWIGEDERTFALKKNEMIVFGWSVVRGFDMDLAGHAEMNPEPVVVRKLEQHAFPARVRVNQLFAD